jgi:4-amino-4-deoxy-L-arabinose transferase-like glycosyltransferase
MYAWNLTQGLGYSGFSPDVVGPDGMAVAHLTAYRSPGTSFYWAGLYRVFGHRYSVVRVSELLLDLLTILLIYGIGYKCYGRTVALLAAAIYAVWPTALIYTSQLASEIQYTFLFCCFILLSLQFAERKSWTLAIGAGFMLGLALLTRGNAIFMVALMVPWGAWQFRKVPYALIRSLAIPIVALLTLVPWAVRNFSVFHAVIPFQTGGGDVLLGSYNRITAYDPSEYGYWVYAVSSLPEYRAQIAAPNNEVVRDQVEKRLAMQWLRSHPDTWWYFIEAKFRRSWTPFLQPQSPLPYRVGMLVSWGPVLVLFVLGVIPTAICSLRTNSPSWILHMGILHFVLTAEVFWGSSRFRYPVEGLIIIVASATLVWLYEHLSGRAASRTSTAEASSAAAT